MQNRMNLAALALRLFPAIVMAFPCASFAQEHSAELKVDKALPAPPSRKAAAVALVATYRFDDLLWENDKTAHRIYGHALEAAEPPSGSGIDSWGKNVSWPFADRQLRTGDQHGYHGEGLDFYNVGTTRGAGGLGIWQDNKLWTSRNYLHARIRKSGGAAADFEVDYAPWPVGVMRKVWEKRRFTLPLGTHFTRMISTLDSDSGEALLVGVGIGKRTTGVSDGEVTVDKDAGLISWWGPEDGAHGRMAIAVRVDPSQIVEIRQDSSDYLAIVKINPGRPFVYYSGSAWNKGQDGFATRAAWDAYVRSQNLDFNLPKD